MSVTFTTEQIKDLVELKDLSKLSGNEIMLIETPDGSNSYKTTVNTIKNRCTNNADITFTIGKILILNTTFLTR